MHSLKRAVLILILFFAIAIPAIINAPKQIEKKLEEERQIQAEKEKRKTYLLGKFDPALHEDFTVVPLSYSMSQSKMYLREESFVAFVKMREAALQDGVTLNIASATRNFDYQKELWEKKWKGVTLVEGKRLPESVPDELARFKKILEYSAAPGTSRHHWGTDIDINGADPAYFNTETGKKVYDWLSKNARLYGFCQTYTFKNKERPTGYNEEKWHWSYFPLARIFTEQYVSLVKDEDIGGFLGGEQVKSLNLINDYVTGINPECQ